MPDRRHARPAHPQPRCRGQPGCVRSPARPPSPGLFLLEATCKRERRSGAALTVTRREHSVAHTLLTYRGRIRFRSGDPLRGSPFDSRCCQIGRANPYARESTLRTTSIILYGGLSADHRPPASNRLPHELPLQELFCRRRERLGRAGTATTRTAAPRTFCRS